MSASFLCGNLIAWSVQMLLLIGTGGLLCAAFRLTAPRPRLLYLQGLLALSLLAPFCAIRSGASGSATGQITTVQTGATALPGADHGLRVNGPQMLLALLIAGAAIRLGWVGLGLLRLRRLRRGAQHLDRLPAAARSICEELQVFPDVYVSAEVLGPVAFGIGRPVVLLPAAFAAADEHMQRSIACHELMHVRRNDWPITLAEEMLRALFWFHPAIWWLLGRIQLTREQVVDQEVIAFTRDRDSYVRTLLAVASVRVEADLAPAPLFLRKRHLAQRVALIQQGARMSIRRMVSSLAFMAPLLLAAAAVCWQAFPLTAGPAEPSDAAGVQVNENGFRVLHRAAVPYPAEAVAKGVSGDVVARVTVDEKGEVTDASIVSGPQALRGAVLASLLQWHFDPDQKIPADRSFEVAVRFTAPPRVSEQPTMADTRPAWPPITGVDVSRLPAPLQEKAAAVLRGHDGERLSAQRMQELSEALRNIDQHLRLGLSAGKEGAALQATLDTQQEPPAFAPSDVKRIRVGAKVQQMNLISKQMPVYPVEAKQAHLQGIVRFTAVIGTDGHVSGLTLVSGDPVLATAAMEAVRNWVYRPTLLNGNPVEVITQIDVNFTLSE